MPLRIRCCIKRYLPLYPYFPYPHDLAIGKCRKPHRFRTADQDRQRPVRAVVLGILKRESMSAYDIQKLMLETSCKPINIFLDFNAVIVNLESMEKEQQRECLDNIESNINVLKSYLEENVDLKENAPDVPATGMAVLHQQFRLVQAIEEWIRALKEELL